jgi:hypothetical protein
MVKNQTDDFSSWGLSLHILFDQFAVAFFQTWSAAATSTQSLKRAPLWHILVGNVGARTHECIIFHAFKPVRHTLQNNTHRRTRTSDT